MDDTPHIPPARPCPICGKPAQAKHRPFCSQRCRLLDLGKWLNGSYAIPAADEPDQIPPTAEDE